MKKTFVYWIFTICALTGCTTLPPVPAKPNLTVPTRFQGASDLKIQTQDTNHDAAWWREFEDSGLNAIVALALQNNQDLAKAKARIDVARAQTNIDKAALSPLLGFNPQAGRSKASRNVDSALSIKSSSSTSSSLQVQQSAYSSRFRLPLDASYEIDLWGRLSDSVQASAHQETASVEDLNAARLSLTTSVVTSYLLLRTHQAELKVLQQVEGLRGEILRALNEKVESGLAESSVVDSAIIAASDANEQTKRAEELIGLDIHGLEVLCGAMPGTLGDLRSSLTTSLRLPPVLVDVPSSVLKQRPDVRRAEAQLDAALSRFSAARADFFPTLKLTTSKGAESSVLSVLLQPGSTIWSLAAQIAYPILDGGRRRAQVSLATAEVEEASRNYQGTVIQALREVEDSLITNDSLLARLAAEEAAVKATSRTAERALQRYQVGLSAKITYLEARQLNLLRQHSLLDLKGQVFMAHATLRKVLGGL